MSLGALKKINRDLKKEITNTQNSIIDCNEEYKNKHLYIEETFLSSKGMIRSGKRRGDNEKKQKKKNNNKRINKTVDDDIEKLSNKDNFSSDDELKNNNNNLMETPIKNDHQQRFDEIDDNINEFNFPGINKNDYIKKNNKKRGSYLNNLNNSNIHNNDENEFIKHKKTENFNQKI